MSEINITPSGTLYGVPKKDNVHPDEYTGLKTFAFEAFGNLFFTDRATAVRFCPDCGDIAEIRPLNTHNGQ